MEEKTKAEGDIITHIVSLPTTFRSDFDDLLFRHSNSQTNGQLSYSSLSRNKLPTFCRDIACFCPCNVQHNIIIIFQEWRPNYDTPYSDWLERVPFLSVVGKV